MQLTLPKPGVRHDPEAVRDLLARLRRGVRAVERFDGLVRIGGHGVMSRLPSPGYGRAGLLRDMLAGRFPYYDAAAEPRYADFHVDPDEAAAFFRRKRIL